MKKILFAAFAATLLAAGCQKTEIVGTTPVNGPEMTFSTEMKKITKADETTNEGTATLQDQGFNLWAYAAYSLENITNVDATSRIYDGMKAMNLVYGEGPWTPSPFKDYYWPGQNKDLRFFAVSGIKGNNASMLNNTNLINHGIAEADDHTITKTSPSMTITDFVVNGTDDLMVADFIEQNQAENDRVVKLNFHHALSKIEFFFKATIPKDADIDVYVQKIEVKDLKTKGTLNATTTGDFTDKFSEPVSLNWGAEETKSTPADFSKVSDQAYTGEVELVKEGETTIYSDKFATIIDPVTTASTPLSFAKWLMLPQTITNKLVEIIYIIGNRQFKAVFPLDASTSTTGATVSEWAINQYIKYTINLSPNMITFDAEVETDWQEQVPGVDHIN